MGQNTLKKVGTAAKEYTELENKCLNNLHPHTHTIKDP
jgi:hypothetical protein